MALREDHQQALRNMYRVYLEATKASVHFEKLKKNTKSHNRQRKEARDDLDLALKPVIREMAVRFAMHELSRMDKEIDAGEWTLDRSLNDRGDQWQDLVPGLEDVPPHKPQYEIDEEAPDWFDD